MESVTLGKTGITVNKNGFGALPIQRISDEEAVYLLRKAYENGITFFDTARAYSDSEHKLGLAFQGMWDKVYVASKTAAVTPEDIWKDLQTSLTTLGRDYLDLYQFHNPSFCPKPGDGSGLYECMLEAKEQGKIRHIGITNHRLAVAEEAIDSGLYETLQFPFSYLSAQQELDLVEKCRKTNMGFIAMKALSGGLINNSAAAYAYLAQFAHVLPIWGYRGKASWMNSSVMWRILRRSPKNWKRSSAMTDRSFRVSSAAAAAIACPVRQALKSITVRGCP